MGKGKSDKPLNDKKVQKIVEDKTFGLKNKNKSKKVQDYVAQVQQNVRGGGKNGQAKTAEWYAAQEAKKKKEKEEKKALEKQMLKMLEAGLGGTLTGKAKKKAEEDKAAEEERKKREAAEQHEKDFAVPLTTLEQVFRVEGKATVIRVCGELVHKDNLVGRTKDGSKECVYAKISDGTTRSPLPVTLIGWTPSTFNIKVGAIVDIRNSLAMVRGHVVDLEVTLGQGTVEEASPTLSDYISVMKKDADELRERGGLPLEEVIEEQRSKLVGMELTPVTEARFLEWKAKKLKTKQEASLKAKHDAEQKFARGEKILSGRALFAYDPTLFKDDEGATDEHITVKSAMEDDSEDDGSEDDGSEEGSEGQDEDDEAQQSQEEEETDPTRKKAPALEDEEDVSLDELDED